MNPDLLLLGARRRFWTPPPMTLGALARFRGAIWPKLGLADLPYGPRPGSPDNITLVDYSETYTDAQQAEFMPVYASRGYNRVPMGPIVDLGYHGQIPPEDSRAPAAFARYLDVAERWERSYGVIPVHFLRPDAGNLGLQWDIDDMTRELEPLFSTPRAQALMRIVSYAWEPGGRYGYNNDWWVRACGWMARVFPNALRCVHLPADQDAPVGGADDGHPNLGAWAWSTIAPYIHVWLVQNAGYTAGTAPEPSPDFLSQFALQFDVNAPASLFSRFQKGYAGWPTFSADWRQSHPYNQTGIVALPAEYWSESGYWNNAPIDAAVTMSRAAMKVGAVGYFDAGGGQV